MRLPPLRFALALALLGCAPPKRISEPRLPVSLPADFRLGFATIAYQSEGTTKADGSRVSSNWSEWEDLGGIQGGERNDHGNGFFDHPEVDLDLSARLGANTFSYGIDWARIEPAPGVFDEGEVERVVDLVLAMRERGLRPLIVLFHWVTPTWVQSPKSGLDLLARTDHAFVEAFEGMVAHVVPRLASLVDDWATFEEPYSILAAEYLAGEHPPGHVLDWDSARKAEVNLMFLHARTYRLVHALDLVDADGDGVPARVGFENLAVDCEPLDPSNPRDVTAAARLDYILNRQFPQAVWDGEVDLDMDGKFDNVSIVPPEGSYPELRRTLDFIGLNYYQRIRVTGGGPFGNVAPIFATPLYDVRQYDRSVPHGDQYEEISAPGLRKEIEDYSRWGVPLMITETGLSDADDDDRPRYLIEHLYTAARARADGYDVRGFYVWTVSDNFEWALGTQARFGLFQVDFSNPDFPRTRTRSADAFAAAAGLWGIDSGLWNAYAARPYSPGPP